MTLIRFSTRLPGAHGTLRSVALGFGWGLLLLAVGGPWCWRIARQARSYSLLLGPFTLSVSLYPHGEKR